VNGRDGARWSRSQQWKNDALYWAAAIAIRVGLSLPKRLLPFVGSWVGTISYLGLAQARKMTLHNLGLVYPAKSGKARRAMALSVFQCLGQNLTDALSLLDPSEDEGRTLRMLPDSARVLADALDQRRGVIYVTAHLGPWERMAGLLAQHGFPITTIARESYDPRFDRLIYQRLRGSRNVEVIYRGSPGAPAALVRALRAGRIVGFLMDLPGRVATRPVSLLGQPSRAPLGPARLALRLESPVVVGSPLLGPDGMPEVHITSLKTKDLAADDRGEEELTQRIIDALGNRIRAWPTAWPWMHPSFETDRLSAQCLPHTPRHVVIKG